MKKRYLALLCAAMLMLALCACKAESSSQTTVTVTSGSTDENGVTTTTTNTSEAGVTVGTDGVKTTENQTAETVVETPAPTEEPEDAQEEEAEEEFTFDDWAARFTGGAIGRNADGDQFVLAWDDPDDITYAALMILNPEGTEVSVREGEVTIAGADDNVHLLLTDTVREVEVPFNFYSSDEGDFAMFFLADADTAVMTEVEYDEVIGTFAQVISAIEG